MIIGFLCIVAAITASFYLMFYADEKMSVILMSIGAFGMIAGIIILVFYACSAYSWVGSEYKANIINREYHTNYTREEVFFASDVIDTVRELDRKRIELNGDLIRGDSK